MSSIGFGGERPGTNDLHRNVCYVRHAIALDERRVKFSPEYICGGDSLPDDVYEENQDGIPRAKEVWFAGSHSDVYVPINISRQLIALNPGIAHSGGGNMPHDRPNRESIPLLWMVNQSSAVGLSVIPSKIVWVDDDLKKMKPEDSMNFGYKLLEILPLSRRTYDQDKKTRCVIIFVDRVLRSVC